MATINVGDKRQPIDYLARDYNSFRKALVDLIPAKLPQWTDRSEADFGVVLIELFAYMADILSYYQDRLANEAFLATAQERRSIINHLRLVGYEMAPAAPATARLSLIVGNNVTQSVEIRKGDQFSTSSTKERKSVLFEYTDDKPLVVDLANPIVAPDSAIDPETGSPLPGSKMFPDLIPVREGRSIVNELVGVSQGAPNQRFALAQPQLLGGSLEVVAETTPPTPAWRLRRNLIFSRRAFTAEELLALEQQDRIGSTLAFSRDADADYTLETDENDVTTVVFGDGQYGQIPPLGIPIRANYRVGGGAAGNVGARQIVNITKAPQLQLLGAKVTNRFPARGGAERESIEHAVQHAPSVFSSMQRAVTEEDYVAQAKLFPGVAKARAEATSWNITRLYIAPAGGGQAPSDILRRDLLRYFEDKRMLTSFIQIESPDYVAIDIEAKIGAHPYFRNIEVEGQADEELRLLFEFDKVDFKQTLYLSKVYEALEKLDGVSNVFVSRFRRSGASEEIAPDGLIELGENDLPVLGELKLTVTGGA